METWPKNFKLIQYNELDSTNSEAKRLAFKDEINTCVFSRNQKNWFEKLPEKLDKLFKT